MNAARWAMVAVVSAMAGITGCADEQEALIVTHSPGFTDYTCIADPTGNVTLQRGTLDVFFETPYTLPVVLRNNLQSRPGTMSNTGVDNGELQLRDVDISLTMEQAPEVIRQVAAENGAYVEFSQTLASNSLMPGQDTGVVINVVTDAASRAFRTAIEANLEAGARPLLTVETVFHATRAGSGNTVGSVGVIDSRAFTFPIELCVGCLPISCETCPDMQCPPDPVFVGPCGNAQDAVLVPNVCELPRG